MANARPQLARQKQCEGCATDATRTDHRCALLSATSAALAADVDPGAFQPYAGGLIDRLAVGTEHLAAEVAAGDLEGAKQAWIANRVSWERGEDPTKRSTAGRMPPDEGASLFPLLTGSACRPLGAADRPV
jgi:hypothetical protein